MNIAFKVPTDNTSPLVQLMGLAPNTRHATIQTNGDHFDAVHVASLCRNALMSPSHCRECCLRTNTNWHSLRIAQHRIDSNYFVLVRCHFRISSQANTNVLKCSKHSYWPCESILFVLRRIASPNVVSIRVSSYWFVSHRCTFVSIRCKFALGFAACLLRLSTLQYDAQRSYCRIGSHMFALVRVSSY